MADVTLSVAGSQAAPLDYTVPGAQEIVLKAGFASFDGTSSGTSFLPCIRVLSPAGLVVGEYFTDTAVLAGASADVSFAPFLRNAPVSSTSSSFAAWAALQNFLNPPGTNPMPFLNFATSDTSVFATSTTAAPTTVSNTTGDKLLLLRAAGLYRLECRGILANGAGTERAIQFDSANSNIDNVFNAAGNDRGDLDHHGLPVESYATVNTVLGGSAESVTDRLIVVVSDTGNPLYTGVKHTQSAALASVALKVAAWYWPSATGGSVY